jgi:glucose-6-phosphate isomerase
MKRRSLRIYAETSVFGGAFDPEFETASRSFFDQVRQGRFTLVTSIVVQREVGPAPPHVKDLFDEMLAQAEVVPVSRQALSLQAA